MTVKTGQEAPDFTLQNTEGEKVTLSDFQGDKNVVLLFFPLAFTGTCTNEMCTMRDNMKIYNALNAKVIGISVDSFFTLKKFKKSENLNFTLLSDFNKSVSKEYGVLYDEFFGMKGVSKRAAFVDDTDGMITYSEVLEDAGNLPDFDAIRDALSGLSN